MLHNPFVTRFNSECSQCEELLTDFIAAANALLELKLRYPTRKEIPTASAHNARQQKNDARRRFITHKRLLHEGL